MNLFAPLRATIPPILGLSASVVMATAAPFPEDPAGWPEASASNKPWTRWWWPGSAVDRANLTRELEGFARAGLGGVEICPIYGAVGAEDRFLDFLSPEWMAMLAHTTTEARRLGLGVDLTTGTGWPFGGPMVTPEMASRGLRAIRADAAGGQPLTLKLPAGDLQCLRAFGTDGKAIDLTATAEGGRLEWTPPPGAWTVHGLTAVPRVQQVKRAAPGGAGDVLDPFSAAAMGRYLGAFDRALTGFSAPLPRAWFHDSFEYYGAAWTPGFVDRFQQSCGYDLRDRLPAFNGLGGREEVTRVRADYRRTLGELHLAYLKAWGDWARGHGGLIRNQAHGGPGNLLDAYAAAGIPETEIFRQVSDDQLPMLRFAASAAHANGTALVSAESFTWLGEHFQVTPAQLKEAADFLFLGGANHLFFHGIPYSPQDAPWPGWLFYASTHMGPNGGLWRDLPAFTGYLQRCQSILQQGAPSSEVLIYFPFEDLIRDGRDKLPLFTVHNQREWLHPTAFHRLAMACLRQGVTHDFASDAMLARATVKDGRIVLGSNAFRVLVLPGVRHLPPATLAQLVRLRDAGGKVVGFANAEAPGFPTLDGDPVAGLASYGVWAEDMTKAGLQFVRRTHAGGYHYFIVNRSAGRINQSIRLAVPCRGALLLDPWNSSRGTLTESAGQTIPIVLEPGASVIVRTFTDTPPAGLPSPSPAAAAPQTIPLGGPWQLSFIEGGPLLPQPAELAKLASWTTLDVPAVKDFSGTGRYASTFRYAGNPHDRVRLDLGEVAHTARVWLNGKPVGTSWCPPHRLDLTGLIAAGDNQLAIEVTNLAANRIADLDRRKVPWKRFHEINFVNRDYKPFDASGWPPLPSGLLGPVTLTTSAAP